MSLRRNCGRNFCTATSLICLAIAGSALAAEPQRSGEWDYPELAVSPRASERLEREARGETTSGRSRHWAIQISSSATLLSGILSLAQPDRGRDPDLKGAWTGVGVGGAWLAATWLISTQYTPYASGMAETSVMPNKSMRDQLARERAAEQAIDGAARMGSRMRWLSVISNGLASAYVTANAREGSVAQVVAIGSLVASLTPIVFPHHWNDVAQQQQDYKKRIFGPVAGITRVSSGELVPVLAMQWKL